MLTLGYAAVLFMDLKTKKIMETNLEKAKELVLAHASIKGVDLKKDNYFFKMLELAATPDVINKNDCLADVVPCLELPDLLVTEPDRDGEFEIAHGEFDFFMNKSDAKKIADFIYYHLNK